MANRYFINGGVDSNWGSTANWASIDGGAGGNSVPGTGDDVFLNAGSPACVLNASARTCRHLDCTGYTGNLDFQQTLTVTGNCTLVSTMTVTAGGGQLKFNAAGTLNSGGLTIPMDVVFSNSVTYTLASDWDINGLVTFGGSTSNIGMNVNGFTIYCGGGISHPGWNITGTTALVMDGPGTWSSATSGVFALNITFNTAGAITVSGNVRKQGVLTWVAGTIVTTGSTLNLTGSLTIDTPNIHWNDIVQGAVALTMTSDVHVDGTYTSSHSGNLSANLNGPGVLILYGSFVQNVGGTVGGTGSIRFAGTGTWTGSISSSFPGRLNVPVEINTAGTITLANWIRVSAAITHTAGTVNGTGSVIITTDATVTITVNAIGFTLGVLHASSNTTFAGTHGCTLQGLHIRAVLSVLFQSGNSYVITDTIVSTGSNGSPNNLRGSTASAVAYLRFDGQFSQLFFTNLTDIDATGGREIRTLGGTLTRTVNCALVTEVDRPDAEVSGGLRRAGGWSGGFRG